MPHYDYQCSECCHTLEAFQKITDSPLTTCPKCQKSTLQRGPGGGVGLVFKGSGFYITDYDPARKAKTQESACCPCSKNTSCST